jgi:uncharacterized Zn finger protein (UPF0148 family)
MYCPSCECPDFKQTGVPGEFVEDVTVCPFCGSALVEEMPEMNPSRARGETERDKGDFDSPEDSSEKLVVIASFSFRHNAELVITYLANNGIDVIESPDDCGGTNPIVGFAAGIRLLAPESQAKRAIALLKKVQGDN